LANHAPSEVVGDMPTIDLTPTLLSLAGVQNDAPFLGEDLLTTGDRPGRAFLNHNHNRNRNIGMLTGDTLMVLGLQKTAQYYRRPSRGSDAFQPAAADDQLREIERSATAVFQTTYELYEHRRYTLEPSASPAVVRSVASPGALWRLP